jgi:hypothetical protein
MGDLWWIKLLLSIFIYNRVNNAKDYQQLQKTNPDNYGWVLISWLATIFLFCFTCKDKISTTCYGNESKISKYLFNITIIIAKIMSGLPTNGIDNIYFW